MDTLTTLMAFSDAISCPKSLTILVVIEFVRVRFCA
jgi:hypothetical protein